MRRLVSAVVITISAALFTACGGSPSSPSFKTANEDPPPALTNPTDIEFVAYMGSFSQAHIELARIAHARGDLAAVKDFARQMDDDFTYHLSRLRTLATREVPVTPVLDAAQQAQRTTLLAAAGSGVDKAYMPWVVSSLTAAITRIQQQGVTASSAAIRGYATDTLQSLQKYLALANDIAPRVR